MNIKEEILKFATKLAEDNEEIFYFENGEPQFKNGKIEFLIKPKTIEKSSMISKKFNLFDQYPEELLKEKILEFAKDKEFQYSISAITHMSDDKPIHCLELNLKE